MRRVLYALPILAGLVAALALTMPSVARAWDIAALPAPYTIDALTNVGAKTGECRTFYVVHWYDQTITLGYGPMVNPLPNFSDDCDPTFQQQLDAFVDATINQTPPAPTSTVAPVTTTDTTATTTVSVTDATTTTATPPVTSPTTTTTAVDTTSTTATCDLACLTARITALETNYTNLAARVDAISKANDASWTAFIDTLNAGGTTTDAALAARSAGLNAIYQLGAT